jgi:hypothetical protein
MSETLALANHDIVNLAAMSLSAAPHLTEDERTARSRTVIRGTMAFQPTDAVQTMVGTVVLGHYLTIMDGFRALACQTLTPAEAARARMAIVAQTKQLLQLLREMRIARMEATPLAAEASEPAPEPARDPAREPIGEAGYEATRAKFQTTYAETLAALENTGTLTPATAAMAREVLSQAVPPALFTTPGDAKVPVPVTGSRAQRRAIMKRNGAFKRSH